jgi:hypothetical protein
MGTMEENLVAPCGMNCAICLAFLGGQKTRCLGCRIRDKKCAFLKGKCKKLAKARVKYCFECRQFPCKPLEKLDEKYRGKYGMSMVENLVSIKEKGIGKFLASQQEKYNCPNCSGTICVHAKKCLECGSGPKIGTRGGLKNLQF